MNSRNIKNNDTEQLVTFLIGHETYGIDIFKVREVINLKKITPIPNTPKCVQGVISVRDQVIPVVNMKIRLGIEVDQEKNRRLIIIEQGGQPLGIIVDNVSQVLTLDTSKDEPLPEEVVNNRNDTCITRLIKQENELIIVISPEFILTKEEQQSLKGVEKHYKGK